MAELSAAGIWRETRAVVTRHRGALMTLGAATVFLPSAALRLLGPSGGQPGVDPAHPVVLPPGFWLLLAAAVVLQFVGVFAVAAITADSEEGGGRTLGQTLAAAVPAMGKFVVALLLFFCVYFVGSLVVGLVLAVIFAVAGIAPLGVRTEAAAGAAGQLPVGLAALFLVVLLPLMVWLWARLAPLVGVYLREPLGVVPGIRRAWSLSRPALRPVVGLILGYLAVVSVLGAVQIGAGGEVGIVSIVFDLATAALSAVVFVYGAAATGIVYRQLAA